MALSETSTASTLTSLFENKHSAQKAVDDLVALGIPAGAVRLLPDYENDGDLQPAAGTVHHGFFQSLADLFMPVEDRYSYAEGLSRGGYLVSVSSVPAGLYEQALAILDDEGSVDLEEQEQSWRGEGWTGYQPKQDSADARAPLTQTAATTDNADKVIPVVQEELQVGKRDVSHGRVRVRSYVVETPVTQQIDLRQETVRVDRRPVDRPVTAADAVGLKDQTVELEERAEEAVVQKSARVVEEVSLTKDTTNRAQTVSDTVKHTEVEIEDERAAANEGSTPARKI